MATLQRAKKELRSRLRKILSEVSKECITAQSSVTTRNLLSLPEYHAAKSLSIYLSMPSGEISTTAIVRDAFSRGKQVYVPYLYQSDPNTAATRDRASVMEMLALRSLEDYESLQPDKWGIPSLDASTIANRKNCLGGYGIPTTTTSQSSSTSTDAEAEGTGLDLIVMPGIAFDEQLRRLGHGKGYYDHFINRLMKKGEVNVNEGKTSTRRPYLVALALGEQLLPPDEKIPVAEHDCPVDALVVGNGRILTSSKKETT
ncbi:5-formyltetrahydrofolate cyclo-ligase [Paracoccidioides lutzii Pb01]|uniref:5-formyltetrahydrofolate cyclo-ligase n=1 Tax=Paracoccidioides lutzii (strain ATCC MYA-826 / Pb01) TaxID=502779 RepID=C1GYW5_PARBA|nr:5-formyltetrahydrofolate cyclo-ligase [Paracoccidioides lutzii Pb01]EEH41788.1 5-formyltetrahydrofolate cyclo-ligase [Paracoccidioides lutzii Pb01]